ncbi:DUF748 domain-containing protein [Marinobacter nanhaiticus D15-8W]|uniref:DUF748 domain-containing protein n=1 Tax=Marinobacter nanhaiticus D15-8W TaxID=626887 RepID=N6WY47_9GAMM|nr:DUF748 domain-containing protein [Marinobacter nanhaiticus]ENO16531.1 DUF748 domain-containing protein [Marinobacter nanhaiticus D15-8W]BES72322.1 DUF748 domain-containing protein [Marinobacter nanhaiticus D15-8W]
MQHRKRKLAWVLLALVIVVVAARVALPEVLQRYVNQTLDDAEGYSGQVGDIDLALWRGAYVIHDIEINKATGEVFAPLFTANRVDLSLLTSALLRGKLVGEAVFRKPLLNIVVEDEEDSSQQTGEEADWRQVLRDLFPLRLDRIEFHDGEFHFRKPDASPPVDAYLTGIEATLTNLTNSRELSDSLAASLSLQAKAMQQGDLTVSMQMDPYREQAHFNFNGKLTNLEISAIDPLIAAYAPVDIEAGSLDLVMELAAEDGRITGYVKPLLRDIDIFEWREDVEKQGDNLFQVVWEGLVGAVAELLENQPKDQFATRIPIEGQIDSPDTETLAAIINVLRNAFINAFEAELEGSVNPSNVEQDSNQ